MAKPALSDAHCKEIGKRLRFLRKHKKLTLEWVATSLGTTKQYLSQIEIGVNLPSLNMLIPLADLYESSTDFILCRTDKVSENSEETVSLSEEYLQSSSTLDEDLVVYTEADVEKIVCDTQRRERQTFIRDLEAIAKNYRRKYNRVKGSEENER